VSGWDLADCTAPRRIVVDATGRAPNSHVDDQRLPQQAIDEISGADR